MRAYGAGGAREAMDYLERACARLERRGIAALPVARRGAPAGAILKYARTVGAGVVCLTTHGRSGLRRLLSRRRSSVVLPARSSRCGAEGFLRAFALIHLRDYKEPFEAEGLLADVDRDLSGPFVGLEIRF